MKDASKDSVVFKFTGKLYINYEQALNKEAIVRILQIL